jgi:hypothetical protein
MDAQQQFQWRAPLLRVLELAMCLPVLLPVCVHRVWVPMMQRAPGLGSMHKPVYRLPDSLEALLQLWRGMY